MVRNSDLPQTSGITKVIADTIRGLIDKEGLSQTQVGDIIGKSQSYASLRIKGMLPWNVDEIDKLAKYFGYSNGFALVDLARGISSKEGDIH